MNAFDFLLCGITCRALPSGALFLPDHRTLCVSDMHLGKSERLARRGGTMLPPYEVLETLEKLGDDLDITQADRVISLGDSFDDLLAADALDPQARSQLRMLQQGRDWVWVEGNHDPGPTALGGRNTAALTLGNLTFRHIATGVRGEISGHYHPKHRVTAASRPAFLCDQDRLIMPAYGAYTGGLSSHHPVFGQLFTGRMLAILTGHKAIPVPVS